MVVAVSDVEIAVAGSSVRSLRQAFHASEVDIVGALSH